jgi:hypothetical protein
MSEQFKIPGYVETGAVNATPLDDGGELFFKEARSDLKRYDAIHHEAVNLAIEVPKQGLFERIPEVPVEWVRLSGEKVEAMRYAEVNNIVNVEAETLALSAMRRDLTQDDMALGA